MMKHVICYVFEMLFDFFLLLRKRVNGKTEIRKLRFDTHTRKNVLETDEKFLQLNYHLTNKTT